MSCNLQSSSSSDDQGWSFTGVGINNNWHFLCIPNCWLLLACYYRIYLYNWHKSLSWKHISSQCPKVHHGHDDWFLIYCINQLSICLSICVNLSGIHLSWWYHYMETLSTLLSLCKENPPVTSGFHSQLTSNVKHWCFLCCQPEQAFEETPRSLVIWAIMMLIWCHYNENKNIDYSLHGISNYWHIHHSHIH